MKAMPIETTNLILIPCDADILNCAIQGNPCIAEKLNVTVPDDWTEFGIGPFQYCLDKLTASEEETGWLTYFPIHKRDNKLVGSGGYKGKPTPEGTVEIGYEIAAAYRNRGLASEMATGLINRAFEDPKVSSILAHTLREENPSTRILKKNGFEKVEEIYDPEDGFIWKWALKRP